MKAAPAPHPSALGEQVSALDAARRALAAGDAPAAVGALDDYAVRFPDGALVEEAQALRVHSETSNEQFQNQNISRIGR